jgi:hypothetical protein
MPVEQPIFFLGMPRSGTTVTFDLFATHPELAWFSQHHNRLARFPSLSLASRLCDVSLGFRKAINKSTEERAWYDKLRVGPIEAYDVLELHCGKKFRYDYLYDVEATPEEREGLRRCVEKVQRYQGKRRFATKITGPARIGYLSSIFPDAQFVHVIRDGRAVVRSLMRVDFWKDTWRMREPAWSGGLSEEQISQWEALDRSPLALAGLQWATVVDKARDEATRLKPSQYYEVRYEDFVQDPLHQLDRMFAFAELPTSPRVEAFLESRYEIQDMNYQWRDEFGGREVAMLDGIMGDLLADLGYLDNDSGPMVDRGSAQQVLAA